MRLWLIKPSKLCDKHLVAEHFECHTFAGAIKKNKNMAGYINNGLVEPSKIKSRHEELVNEMLKRGFKHKSKLDSFDLNGLDGKGFVNIEENEKLLSERCSECKKLMGASND